MNKKIFLREIRKILLCFIIFLAIMAIIIGIGWALIYKTDDQSKFSIMQTSNHITYLTFNQWKNIQSKYFLLVKNHDPRIALEILRVEVKTNNALSRNCHELTHEIGHIAFKKYKTFEKAIQFQDEICNSGYMHGILESYFEENKTTITQAVHKICLGYKKSNYNAWECYHGIGHGIMFATNNNVPKSITLCKSLLNNFAYSACVNGIFMQNFTTDNFIHPTKYVSKHNYFYPCIQQQYQDMSNCYEYAPIYFLNLHANSYSQALEWCESAPYLFIASCASGVGSEMTKQNINNPMLAKIICSNGPSNVQEPCLRGMINLYILHYGSLQPAEKFCNKMSNKEKSVCINEILSLRQLFL
ncbi:MAG TPA: hypothetical protein VNW29_07055 [Candidatus Sulfotelmatobacter sp.]|jgi:hypothetical protein|nr:hypothetical protein [Candidatus Sulfotelmatobacter sp.]